MAAMFWTREHVVDAIQRWTALHGRAPGAREWRAAAPGFPSSVTVRERFGTFEAARQAAGVTFLRSNQVGAWTRDEIVAAVFRWMFLYGELPRACDWDVSRDGFPTEWWVRKRFGTWNAAIVAAGYEPRCPRRSSHGYRALMAHVTKAAA